MRSAAAVVGAGLMGHWHARSLKWLGIPIAAIVDPDRGRAERLASRTGAGRICLDLDELLGEDDAAVLHVCTPAELHTEQVERGLAAGRHVLVEKPLAHSAAATRALYELAARHRVLLCPVHQFPFQRGAAALRARIDRIGAIRHVDFVACSAGAAGGPDELRDRVAADILPHPLSLMARLLPVPFDACSWTIDRTGPGELRLTGTAGRVSAGILISMAGRPPVNALRVIGERGTVHVDLFHGFAVREPAAVSRGRKIARPFAFGLASLTAAATNLAGRTLRREPAYPGLRELIADFHAAAAAGAPPPIDPAEVVQIATIRDMLTAPAVG